MEDQSEPLRPRPSPITTVNSNTHDYDIKHEVVPLSDSELDKVQNLNKNSIGIRNTHEPLSPSLCNFTKITFRKTCIFPQNIRQDVRRFPTWLHFRHGRIRNWLRYPYPSLGLHPSRSPLRYPTCFPCCYRLLLVTLYARLKSSSPSPPQLQSDRSKGRWRFLG